MAKKVKSMIKLQVPAAKATPAPPIGPALGQHGVNIPGFCKEFNERTQKDAGMIIPVVITVYTDNTFSFITKTPPVPVLIKKELNLQTASGRPNRDKVGKLTQEQVRKIAEIKNLIENAVILENVPTGSAISMGSRVTVREVGEEDEETYEIVGSQEANPILGRISDESPLGRSLMGKKKGDRIEFEAPGGVIYYEILNCEN